MGLLENVLKEYKKCKYLVTVIWEDCNCYGGIKDVRDDFETIFVATSGLLLSEDKNQVVVTHEIFDDRGVRHTSVIPRTQIRKILKYEIKKGDQK